MHREILDLHFRLGKRPAEIARELNIKYWIVYKTICREREILLMPSLSTIYKLNKKVTYHPNHPDYQRIKNLVIKLYFNQAKRMAEIENELGVTRAFIKPILDKEKAKRNVKTNVKHQSPTFVKKSPEKIKVGGITEENKEAIKSLLKQGVNWEEIKFKLGLSNYDVVNAKKQIEL